MRTLYLHVGMHKTGTTSIQLTLDTHREALQAAGYSWFPNEDPNHSRAVYGAFADRPHRYHANRRLGAHTPQAAEAFADASRARLAAFLDDAPGPNLVISGEDIAMLQEPAKRRLLEFLRPRVDRIIVIGMVRPPRGFIASAIQQRIRGGRTLEDLADGRGTLPDYRRRFETFLTAAEVAETRLHLYVPDALRHGCSVATFLALIDAPEALYGRLEVVRANAGTSHLGVALMLAANEAVPVFLEDRSANPRRALRLVDFLDGLAGPRFAAPDALVAGFLREAAGDIAWMEARLGIAFPASETTPDPADSLRASDPRSLSWDEIRTLVQALNGLLRDRAGTRRADDAAQRRALTPEQEARRAARRAARLNGRPRGGDAA